MLAYAAISRGAGITVHTTSFGALRSELGENAFTVDKISVEGPMDASDFYTLWQCAHLGKLVEIDLTAANIKDATVPPYAFFHPEEQQSADGSFTLLPLRRVMLPSDVLEIGAESFAYTGITALTLPEALEEIGSAAFMSCRNLSGTVTIPERVRVVPQDCFRECVGLEKVTLTQSVRNICAGAFARSGLRTVDIPRGLREIGDGAFCGARRLEVIAVPNSCRQIGIEAFSGCTSLIYLQLPAHLTFVPAGVASHCTALMTVNLPDDAIGVEPDAFRYCTSLRCVALPDGLEYIAARAFEHSGIDYVALPASVKYVGNGFVSGCPNLKAIYSTTPIPPLAGELPYNNEDSSRKALSSVRWTPFYAVDEALPVYVPAECTDVYRNAWGWDKFSNFRELPDGFDIHNVDAVEQLAAGEDAPQIHSGAGYIRLSAGSSGQSFDYSIYTVAGAVQSVGRCQDTAEVFCEPGIYIIKAGATVKKIAVN